MLTFTPYSAKKKFKNLYISNEIVDDELKDVNKVLVRVPNTEMPITDLLLCFDGQNLFDENTSHFGSIFNLENLIQSAEVKQKSNVLVIATTSNRQRKIQYNPYPRDHSETSIQHLKEIHKTYIPEVVNNFNLEITHTKKHVLGASMGGLMAIKFSIINPEFKNVICLSPAFWYGFPGVLEDIKNIQKSTFLHLYTGKKEGHIFGDKVNKIFPTNWNLDFSTNDNFYLSGVNLIEKTLTKHNLSHEFFTEEEGMHNETYWRKELTRYLQKNL